MRGARGDSMAEYNGHRNWDYWNVSLWINNDERLYRSALDLVRSSANRTEAAGRFMALVRDGAIDEVTPDGARYSIDRVRRAMRGHGVARRSMPIRATFSTT